MYLFKPQNYGNLNSEEAPTVPRYSVSSYSQQTTKPAPTNPSKFSMVSRKYNFERSMNSDDIGSFPLEPELPVYTGSFLFQQQFQSTDDHQLFTSYSRRFAEKKNEELNKQNKNKIPVFSYRSRFDLFDGPSTFNSDSDGIEQPRHSANVTNYRNISKEKKQNTVEPLIPIRRYQKEKKVYNLSENQNLSSNFDICKYGIARPPSKEEEINRQNAEQFARKTKVNRVYPDILMADEFGADGARSRTTKDDFSSSSSSPVADKSNGNKGCQFIPSSSNYIPKGDQKPMFSQFKSDVFAKYAERKLNEKNNSSSNQTVDQPRKYDFESDSDAFLFDSSPHEKSSTKSKKSNLTNKGNDDKVFIPNYQVNDQGIIPCKAKEDYERRKAQIDEEDLISQSDMEEKNANKNITSNINSNNNNNNNNNNNSNNDDDLSSSKHIDDLLNSKESDNIMARLEQFKKTMEESKRSTQYYGESIARHNINVSDSADNQDSLLSESESADTSKVQDDMLSEPSLIFEEKL